MMRRETLVLDSSKYVLAESYCITEVGTIYEKGKTLPLRIYNSGKGKVVKLKVRKYEYTEETGIVEYDEEVIEKEYKVTRLMAATFIPKNGADVFFGRNQVYIKDRDYENFDPENLMWANSDETNALLTFINAKENALEKYIRYCCKHYITNAQIMYLLEESGYINKIEKRFFKKRYITKMIDKIKIDKIKLEIKEETNNI